MIIAASNGHDKAVRALRGLGASDDPGVNRRCLAMFGVTDAASPCPVLSRHRVADHINARARCPSIPSYPIPSYPILSHPRAVPEPAEPEPPTLPLGGGRAKANAGPDTLSLARHRVQASASAATAEGRTALHWASTKGKLGVVMLLVADTSADKNAQDRMGEPSDSQTRTHACKAPVVYCMHSQPASQPAFRRHVLLSLRRARFALRRISSVSQFMCCFREGLR